MLYIRCCSLLEGLVTVEASSWNIGSGNHHTQGLKTATAEGERVWQALQQRGGEVAGVERGGGGAAALYTVGWPATFAPELDLRPGHCCSVRSKYSAQKRSRS